MCHRPLGKTSICDPQDVGSIQPRGSTGRGHQIIRVTQAGKNLLEQSRTHYQQVWSEVTREMQALSEYTDWAVEEFAGSAADESGLFVELSFDQNEDIAAP